MSPYLVDAIESPTEDIRLICLKPLGDPIPFKPGQYIEALLPKSQRLPLSIANTPNADGKLHFHIRLHPNTLANAFVKVLEEQGAITLAGPFGSATLDRVAQPKTLFLAGGVGFAPIEGLLTAFLSASQTGPCHLFWGIKQLKDCYALDLIQKWQKQYVNFDFTLALSQPDSDPTWRGERGFVHECLIKQYPDLSDCDVVACGPQAMIDAAFTTFQAHGLKRNSFISDAKLPVLSS